VVDLVIRERFEASDPEAASGAFRAVFGDGDVAAEVPALKWMQSSLVDDGISATRITSEGTRVVATLPGSPDLVVVLVRSGALRLRRGSDDVTLEEGAIGMIPMEEPVELGWDEVGLDLFSLPLTSIARLLGAEGGAVRISAPSIVPLNEALAEYWRRLAAGLMFQMLSEPELYRRDLLRAQLVDTLAATTIEAFGLTNPTEVDPRDSAETARRAISYMESHLGSPISVTQVAAATGISVRGLQLLFQRELASTPVAHLRRLRMTGARVALETPTRGTTVGAIGRRFGYSNLGRFSAHYRAEFDEAPSRTLQRAQESASR
jgi:AraC-like DNA-binding protein